MNKLMKDDFHMAKRSFHSNHKGYDIFEVVQSGFATYDVISPYDVHWREDKWDDVIASIEADIEATHRI